MRVLDSRKSLGRPFEERANQEVEKRETLGTTLIAKGKPSQSRVVQFLKKKRVKELYFGKALRKSIAAGWQPPLVPARARALQQKKGGIIYMILDIL